MSTVQFPNELWLEIFRWATTFEHLSWLLNPRFIPFNHFSDLDPNPNTPEEKLVRSTLSALALTSREWRALSLPYFYEIITITCSSCHGLLETFEKSDRALNGHGYGRYVRRLVLSALDPNHPIPHDALTRIMLLCPNAKFLVKRDDDLTPFPFPAVGGNLQVAHALASVIRFDWWFIRCREMEDLAFVDFNLDQGLDVFRTLVEHAPNLRYLSIGIRHPTSRLSLHPARSLTLKSVTTLRLRNLSSTLRREIEGWRFPNLKHIITDASLLWNECSSLFTPRIEVVEFMGDACMVQLSPLRTLECCTNLRELYYHIEYGTFVHQRKENIALERVGIHAGLNFTLRRTMDVENGFDIWDHYEHHFKTLAGYAFPALREVVLYGDWSDIVGDDRFAVMVLECGGGFAQRLTYSNGSRVVL